MTSFQLSFIIWVTIGVLAHVIIFSVVFFSKEDDADEMAHEFRKTYWGLSMMFGEYKAKIIIFGMLACQVLFWPIIIIVNSEKKK